MPQPPATGSWFSVPAHILSPGAESSSYTPMGGGGGCTTGNLPGYLGPNLLQASEAGPCAAPEGDREEREDQASSFSVPGSHRRHLPSMTDIFNRSSVDPGSWYSEKLLCHHSWARTRLVALDQEPACPSSCDSVWPLHPPPEPLRDMLILFSFPSMSLYCFLIGFCENSILLISSFPFNSLHA